MAKVDDFKGSDVTVIDVAPNQRLIGTSRTRSKRGVRSGLNEARLSMVRVVD